MQMRQQKGWFREEKKERKKNTLELVQSNLKVRFLGLRTVYKGPMETDGLPLSGRETTLAPKSMAHGRVELFADTNTGYRHKLSTPCTPSSPTKDLKNVES